MSRRVKKEAEVVFVSTGGFSKASAFETAQKFIESGINNIELSGGRYAPTLRKDLETLNGQCNLRTHNYFPPQEKPFVLNLSSLNEELSRLSVDYYKEAMTWAVALGSDVYSFHPGSLVDLHVDELGQKIEKRKLFDRQKATERLVNNVKELSRFASENGLHLFVENNVLTRSNFLEFGDDPLLMTTPEETRFLMEQFPGNVSLLIDVAHLKVSAHTLGFQPARMFEACDKWIKGYHLSDNDGTADSNEAVRDDSWFWPSLRKDLDYCVLEVYNVGYQTLKEQMDFVKGKLS